LRKSHSSGDSSAMVLCERYRFLVSFRKPALYSLAITGAAVSIIPLVALVLFLQRFWKLDLISGGIKG
jgi:ABC-type glycerol-3-phosphate transport system permease component